MNNTIVKIKKMNESAIIPTRGSDAAAGYDLYAILDKEQLAIAPHSTVMIDTGLAFALPDNTFGAIFARSGLASKKGLRPGNCVGVIDSDYRGSVKVALHNDSNKFQVITANERVAQLVILPYVPVEFEEVNELDETNRGENGFGSTGAQ